MIKLTYAGLSQAEVETIYKLFQQFGVEEKEEELSEEYSSMINIEMHFRYEPQFFKIFGFDRWEDLKTLLKNIKWRRGNKRFRFSLCFKDNPDVEFSLLTSSDLAMNKAVDIIEYLADSIILQLRSIDIDNIKRVILELKDYRWSIGKVIDHNGNEYHYIDNRWRKV